MDTDLRCLERRAEETKNDVDVYKFRYQQLRNNINIKPEPGDLVEIKNHSERSRGIYLGCSRTTYYGTYRYPANYLRTPKITLWFIKIKDNICRFEKLGRKFQLTVIEPIMPGVLPPSESLWSKQRIRFESIPIDLAHPPFSIIQFNTESIHLMLSNKKITIKEALLQHAHHLGFADPDNLLIPNVEAQSMFSNPILTSVMYRAQGKVVPHYTTLQDGFMYTINIVYTNKGG